MVTGKKSSVIFLFILFSSVSLFAQRFAYVDSDYILKSVPEYASAQKQLEVVSVRWQQEIDQRVQEIEKLKKAYHADKVLLTEEMLKNREADIKEKEQQLQDFQHAKFGVQGELFKQRVKLIRPIQDRIAKAIEALATGLHLDMIFDKNSEVTFLYANPRLDKSNEVLTRMGYKPTALQKP